MTCSPGSLLAENGIREPLYLTAMRYAGIAVTPEKRPAHIDSVVLDKADTARLHSWFQAEPLPAPKPAPEPLLEVRDLCFGYNKVSIRCKTSAFPSARARWSASWVATARANPRCPS